MLEPVSLAGGRGRPRSGWIGFTYFPLPSEILQANAGIPGWCLSSPCSTMGDMEMNEPSYWTEQGPLGVYCYVQDERARTRHTRLCGSQAEADEFGAKLVASLIGRNEVERS